MHAIDFYLDFVSPYAFVAFERLPVALQGLTYRVRYRPVLLGALLQHHGTVGPAVQPGPKRDWTYRHAQWLAQAGGSPMQAPAAHPFNPLPLLRLALACADADGAVNREVAGTLLRHVWQSGGADATDAARLAAVTATLAPARAPDSAGVKALLRERTDAALAAGVFGVPAFAVDDKLFWGQDALPMLRACLDGDPWFAPGAGWDAAATTPSGIAPAPRQAGLG